MVFAGTGFSYVFAQAAGNFWQELWVRGGKFCMIGLLLYDWATVVACIAAYEKSRKKYDNRHD